MELKIDFRPSELTIKMIYFRHQKPKMVKYNVQARDHIHCPALVQLLRLMEDQTFKFYFADDVFVFQKYVPLLFLPIV